jgi:hypothetical protein
MIPISKIFEILETHRQRSVFRHELFSADFGNLRRGTRGIIQRLSTDGDESSRELSEHLRVNLSQWLTVPVPFDCSLASAFDVLGPPAAIARRWGQEIATLANDSIAAAESLAKEENPIWVCLRNTIREMRSEAKSFKIFCHKNAVPHFTSITLGDDEAPLNPDLFLHTVRDYRESAIFDVLIKIGPLRAKGWGSVPDAICSAPRFSSLIQLVWSGCLDDQDFGYDPVSKASLLGKEPSTMLASDDSLTHQILWRSEKQLHGFPEAQFASAAGVDEDDLQILDPRRGSFSDNRGATLLQIDSEHGILFPPLASVLSFDPSIDAPESIDFRLPGESLLEGMYLILPRVDDIDFGGVHAEQDQYSRVWKARLKEEYKTDPEGLETRLRASGLNLLRLGLALDHWCDQPTTVIHAPQKRRHFEILISELGCGTDIQGLNQMTWKALAWNEVRKSRGEAIQAGMQAHQIVDEEMVCTLREHATEILAGVSSTTPFSLQIPFGGTSECDFRFFKISEVEEGFLAPASELKIIGKLNLFEQWRV